MIAEVRALVTREVLELRALFLDLERRQHESEERVKQLLRETRRAQKRLERARASDPAASPPGKGWPDEEEASERRSGKNAPLDDQTVPR
jgi:hypothetical protein